MSLLLPPIAFLIVFAAALLLSAGFKQLSLREAGPQKGVEPYSCGEVLPSHMIKPDYGQFLPFAVFFTVLHVVALTVATVPAWTLGSFVMALIYLAAALVGLTVLYRK